MAYYRQTFVVGDTDITCSISDQNVCIFKSHKITSRKDMKSAIKMIRTYAEKECGITYKRSESEWLVEWRAHNLLYSFDYQPERTKNVDLNEDESKTRKSLYRILSFLYNFIKK